MVGNVSRVIFSPYVLISAGIFLIVYITILGYYYPRPGEWMELIRDDKSRERFRNRKVMIDSLKDKKFEAVFPEFTEMSRDKHVEGLLKKGNLKGAKEYIWTQLRECVDCTADPEKLYMYLKYLFLVEGMR
jgi:hypothetical protein